MTTRICSSNIRPKWPSQRWSIASKASPRVVSDTSILTSPSDITRAFFSTLKTNGKTCACYALNLVYLRPEQRGFTRSPIRGEPKAAGGRMG
jgi:hypothetical protein